MTSIYSNDVGGASVDDVIFANNVIKSMVKHNSNYNNETQFFNISSPNDFVFVEGVSVDFLVKEGTNTSMINSMSFDIPYHLKYKYIKEYITHSLLLRCFPDHSERRLGMFNIYTLKMEDCYMYSKIFRLLVDIYYDTNERSFGAELRQMDPNYVARSMSYKEEMKVKAIYDSSFLQLFGLDTLYLELFPVNEIYELLSEEDSDQDNDEDSDYETEDYSSVFKNERNDDCPICYENTTVREYYQCCHGICQECFEQWRETLNEQSHKCPCCRSKKITPRSI